MKKERLRRVKKLLVPALLCLFVLAAFLLWQESTEHEIRKTLDAVRNISSDLTLAIYTDIHHDPESRKDVYADTIDCMGRIMASADVDALWNLGDIINGSKTTRTEAEAQIRDVTEAENAVTPFAHRIAGNHDSNVRSTWESGPGFGPEEVLSPQDLADILGNQGMEQQEIRSDLRPTDYYVDFDRVRVICVSTDDVTFTEETARWLEDALDTDQQALFLAHCPTRPEWGYYGDIQGGEQIEQVIRDFQAEGGTVIAWIHGHDHGDMIQDADGWKEIAIGCARYQVPGGASTEGMEYAKRHRWGASRFLFDVVSIDTQTRTVHLTRFGAGPDREITY